MSHGCPAGPSDVERWGGDFATGVCVILFAIVVNLFAIVNLFASSIVRPYLSVNPLGREEEGVEAVNLGEKTLLKDTIIKRQPFCKT